MCVCIGACAHTLCGVAAVGQCQGTSAAFLARELWGAMCKDKFKFAGVSANTTASNMLALGKREGSLVQCDSEVGGGSDFQSLPSSSLF